MYFTVYQRMTTYHDVPLANSFVINRRTTRILSISKLSTLAHFGNTKTKLDITLPSKHCINLPQFFSATRRRVILSTITMELSVSQMSLIGMCFKKDTTVSSKKRIVVLCYDHFFDNYDIKLYTNR